MAASGNGHRCQRRLDISTPMPSWAVTRPLDRPPRKLQSIGCGIAWLDPAGAAAASPHDQLKWPIGIRLMTLRRGVDPRRFALLSFGGAAGLHAAAVARELDISASSCRPRVGAVAMGQC